MSDYIQTNNFTSKTSTNDVIDGADIDTELGNLVTSVASKANKVISATANNIPKLSAAGDLVDSGILDTDLYHIGSTNITTIAQGGTGESTLAGTKSALGSTETGSVITWLTSTAPTNYLECNGAAVSRTVYDDLFAVVGTQFGIGDGSTTFNLPDFRGYFLRGWDHGAGIDPDAGSRTDRGDGTTGDNVGTIQQDEFESHTHTFGIETEGTAGGGDSVDNSADADYTTNARGGNETRPKNINVMYCIRT
jgi:microcystin-dependent protein